MPLPSATGNQPGQSFGKNPADHDKRTLELADYLSGPVEYNNAPLWVPPEVKPPNALQWPAFGNRVRGDCVPAALIHLQQVFSYLAQQQAGAAPSNPAIPDDSTALELYEATGKYDPADANTDRGVTLLHALKWWRKQSQLGTALDKYGLAPISTFAAWEPGNLEQLRGTVATLGGMLLGLRMPLTAQLQRVWSVPPGGPQNWGAPGSWQGHCVLAVGYNAECVQCVTWGGIQPLSWQFISTYCDEAFAVFSDTANVRVWEKQDWTPDSRPEFVAREEIILPATQSVSQRNLAVAIRDDTAALADVPRWGWEGRIWI